MAEGLKLFQDEPVEFEPGQRYSYNNSGYFLLGAILEKRGGLPYGQYVEQRLIRAAGLQSIFYGGTDSLIPHRARGYSRSGERFVNARHVSLTQGFFEVENGQAMRLEITQYGALRFQAGRR